MLHSPAPVALQGQRTQLRSTVTNGNRAAAAKEATETKRLDKEAGDARACISDGGAGLAALAVAREINKIGAYLRQHVELRFTVGSYCNDTEDQTLAQVLRHPTGDQAEANLAPKVPSTKMTGVKNWRRMRLTHLQVSLHHLEPELFTQEWFGAKRQDIVSLQERADLFLEYFCHALHVSPDSDNPFAEFPPQLEYLETGIGVMNAKYVQYGCRFAKGLPNTLYYFKLGYHDGVNTIAGLGGAFIRSPAHGVVTSTSPVPWRKLVSHQRCRASKHRC